jgi:monoamine oxidase
MPRRGRTPLLRTLSRALDLARVARASGRSAADVVAESRAARSWTRRDLLATSALAGAGLALGCRRDDTGSRAAREVAIVGGGIAGLTCAWRLRRAGVAVRVYEAQQRIGGRMWSLRGQFPDGQVCELGGELIDTGHAHLRALCRELGLALDDFRDDAPELVRDVWWFGGARRSEEDLVEAFRPLAAKMDAARADLPGDVISYRTPAGAETIDRVSLAEWLEGAGASGWFRDLLDVAYTTEYGLEIAEQSPWNLLTLIDTEPEPFRVFGDSDERFHVRGGNDLVPTRLAHELGDRIELGCRLEALSAAPDGSYRLELAQGSSSRTVAADHVVLALPFTLLREVELELPLPPVKKKAIAELGYGTNAKLMVGFSERLWRTAGGSNGSVLSDLPFQLVWEASRMQPGAAGILVCYTGGKRGVEMGVGSGEEQAKRFAELLDGVFPGVAALRGTQARFHWPSFPWTKASYACYRPGQWTTIAGAEGERVGNLHFAGEHTSAEFQGYMEGGCSSGLRAAGEILEDLGLLGPEAPPPGPPAPQQSAALAGPDTARRA